MCFSGRGHKKKNNGEIRRKRREYALNAPDCCAEYSFFKITVLIRKSNYRADGEDSGGAGNRVECIESSQWACFLEKKKYAETVSLLQSKMCCRGNLMW